MFRRLHTSHGDPYPLGATLNPNGVNFAIFSAHAEKIELCVFDDTGESELERIVLSGRTDDIWHVHVAGLSSGSVYGYRVYGPYEPHKGHRFNPHKLLLDPYAKHTVGRFEWTANMFAYDTEDLQQDLSFDTQDNAANMLKGVVLDETDLNSPIKSSCKPNVAWRQTVIYETHVKGFTKRHIAVPMQERGTFAGLAHPEVLSYIKSLGITAIELLPVNTFIDEKFLVEHQLTNYWGYNSLNFFMPHQAYLASGQRAEFKQFVDAAHEEGLEVILDVVYNHTAEGNHLGPTLSFRGIDNASYYALATHDARFYANDTGCGNTLNLKHPRVLQMVMDSLRFWAGTMGVDGFRFDLATVMGRETNGFNASAGFFHAVKQDPILTQCKMIAEPWDIGPGGYQLGAYPSGWSEWNDRYRDTVRRFWKGDLGMLPEMARRVHGSSDIFEHSGRGPSSSINFITSHDGFTLNDLVSYNQRNNLANKEHNNDGHHANFSENHGVEGETGDPEILALRARQKRNFIATLFLSQGTPMLLSGDEVGKTQSGNNNAYCQDTALNWIDWENLTERDEHLREFTRYVISLRRQYPMLTSRNYIHRPDEPDDKDASRVRWFSIAGEEMREEQWSEQHVHVLGWLLEKNCFETIDSSERTMLFVIFNGGDEDINYRLPTLPHVETWKSLLDTAREEVVVKLGDIEIESQVKVIKKSMRLLLALF